MGATLKQAGAGRLVTLEGDLTLPHAEEMKKAFLKALVEADDVSIGFNDIRDVDLSCLQMLCSVHRSALRLKKQVRFADIPPKILKAAADATGYSRLKGCKLDCEKSCLWAVVAGENHG